jgi:DNA polymerase III sliding clamp (beta) subunit (PCNA family)
MKITVSAQDLKETLKIAQSTLSSNQDITSHFIFTSEEAGLSVMSCSPPRQFSKIPVIGATVQDKGTFSIDGKSLITAASVCTGVVEIEYDDEDKSVSLTMENTSSAATGSLDPESFPPWIKKFEQATKTAEISSSILYDALNTNRHFVSQDDTRRPELAMVLIEDGHAYACDGFMLNISKHDDLKGMDVKIHNKDIAPLMRFLKSYEGNVIEVLNGGSATFFKAEDGALFGVMDLPYTFPPITQQYSNAFDWTPRRVWRLSKENFINGITFLSAFADKNNLKVTFTDPEDETLMSPSISMKPDKGKGSLSYNLEVPAFEHSETPLDQISNLSDLMYATRLKEEGEGDDISSFDFNYLSVKKAIETYNDVVTFGCNPEGKKGYMLFKSDQDSGVQTVSIIGWMM